MFCWDSLPGPDLGYKSLPFPSTAGIQSTVGVLSFGLRNVHKPDLRRGQLFSRKHKSWQRNLDEVLLNDKRVVCKTTSGHAPQLNPSVAIKHDCPLPTRYLWISCSERRPLVSSHMLQGFLLGALPVWIQQSALLLWVLLCPIGSIIPTPVETGQFPIPLHSGDFLLIPHPQPSFLVKIWACLEILLCKEHLCPPVWWITDLQKEPAKGRPREGWRMGKVNDQSEAEQKPTPVSLGLSFFLSYKSRSK